MIKEYVIKCGSNFESAITYMVYTETAQIALESAVNKYFKTNGVLENIWFTTNTLGDEIVIFDESINDKSDNIVEIEPLMDENWISVWSGYIEKPSPTRESRTRFKHLQSISSFLREN